MPVAHRCTFDVGTTDVHPHGYRCGPAGTGRWIAPRRDHLEKVFELADRFLLSGQEVQVHAKLLKAIHAAKRAEERATGRARVPFPLE